MRRQLPVVFVLWVLSVMLIPLGTMHAHLEDSNHESLLAVDRGGHSTIAHAADMDGPLHRYHHGEVGHPIIHGGHTHTTDYVVDLSLTAIAEGDSPAAFWAGWLPLACVLVFLIVGLQLWIGLRPPSRSDPAPRTTAIRWHPPPRGPPAVSL